MGTTELVDLHFVSFYFNLFSSKCQRNLPNLQIWLLLCSSASKIKLKYIEYGIFPYWQFCFPLFQLPGMNCHMKILNKNKQLISFKLCTILRHVVKCWAVLLCPTWNVNHLFVCTCRCYYPPVSHSLGILVIRSPVTSDLGLIILILLNNSPKTQE